MLKTVLIIVISVSIFGILFFLYVKKMLKKRLDYYLFKQGNIIKKNDVTPVKVITSKGYQKISNEIQEKNIKEILENQGKPLVQAWEASQAQLSTLHVLPKMLCENHQKPLEGLPKLKLKNRCRISIGFS